MKTLLALELRRVFGQRLKIPENMVYYVQMDVGISPNSVRKPKLLGL